MFVLARALTWATLFVATFLVFVPARLLAPTGLPRPPAFGAVELAGAALTTLGMALAVWCVWSFARVGRGTPAPFDPPRRLVVRGPYRWLRNPMYVGATVALAGAAIVYRSPVLAAYAAMFVAALHVLVVAYEEPTLRRTFGADYDAYCARVQRWWPTWPRDPQTLTAPDGTCQCPCHTAFAVVLHAADCCRGCPHCGRRIPLGVDAHDCAPQR